MIDEHGVRVTEGLNTVVASLGIPLSSGWLITLSFNGGQ